MFVSKKKYVELAKETTMLAIENHYLQVKIAKVEREINQYIENMNKIIGLGK